MPGTAAEFYRGPHDGLVLDIDGIKRYCHLVRAGGGDEEARLFALMPTLVEWDHIVSGDLDKDGPFGTLYPYELERRDGGAAFLFRRHDEFREAVEGN
jgi:hypothetical protein